MSNINFLTEERKKVIYNIENAIMAGNSFAKVELSDPKITSKDVEKIIIPFDNRRGSVFAKSKSFIARKLAENLTRKNNKYTVICGIENALSVRGGAIITSNHYNPTDSTPIRMMACACDKRKKLHIIIEESNVFMKGLFGFLMRNCNTHPVSRSKEYMVNNLKPEIEHLLKEKSYLLIYPEEQMWYNYKKPRALRDGAYHYAALYGVPVIPTFTEMITQNGERDANGFLPVQHVLHILPPIYPDPSLSVRENRIIMQTKDYELKQKAYEDIYKIPLSEDFIAERDIAGITPD